MNASEIEVEEPLDMSDERVVQEVTHATQAGNQCSKTFSDALAARAEAQEWHDRFRKVLPADTVNRVGLLVDGERIVLFDAALWVRGGLSIGTSSPDPIFHVDPRLLPPRQ
jgi:hypothetical protein